MTAAAGGDEIASGLLRHLPGQNVFQISAGIAPNAWSKLPAPEDGHLEARDLDTAQVLKKISRPGLPGV
jgi:hypothetical protein